MVSFQTVPRSRGRCRKPARLSENLGYVRGQLKLFLIVLSILCFTFENFTTAAPPSSVSQKLKWKTTPVINRNATAYYDALQRMLASAANFSSVCGKSTLNSTEIDVQGKAINLTKSNHKFYNDDDDEDGQGYRIISGLKAERGQFPWVVALRGIPFPFAILPMHLLKIPLLFARLSMGWLRPKFADAPLPKLILETLKSEGWFHFCGGTLVSDEWVLTAAHCFAPSVSQRLPPKYAITAGTVSWLDELGTRPSGLPLDENNSGDEPRSSSSATGSAMAEVHIHPLYLRDTYTHDIALVRLKYKLPIDKSRPDILPACLPPHTAVAVHIANTTTVAAIKQQNSSSTATSGLIAGWGIKHEKSLKVMNKQMRYTSVKLINDMKQCEQTLQTKMVRDATICAGNIYDQVDQMTVRDACQGDSGGPLTTFDTNTQRWTVSGIISFGIGCGRLGMPSIYTNVSHYLSQTYDSLLNTTAAFKWN